MKEQKFENQLEKTKNLLEHWVDLLRNDGNIQNITEWMLQESNRIQILLDHYKVGK